VGRSLVNPSVIGTLPDLLPLVQSHRVSLIIVALDDRRGKMPVSELLQCRLAGIRVEEGTSFYERLTGKIQVRNLRPSWLVFSQGFNKPRLLLTGKRAGELVTAALALLLVAPFLILIALLIKLDSRGPVFYRQERVGEKGRSFSLLKFRTMHTNAEAATGPVWATGTEDRRLTRVGRLLRRARLDELPQLLNVLAGEMSYCGPRPERPHFVEQLRHIIPYYGERHSVKPGITGWAQIKFGYGSNIEDAEEKLQYDLYYVKHMSLRLDLGIIVDTLKVMVTGRGAR
jgi:sugar transferase (PEP-CTERM system associated)